LFFIILGIVLSANEQQNTGGKRFISEEVISDPEAFMLQKEIFEMAARSLHEAEDDQSSAMAVLGNEDHFGIIFIYTDEGQYQDEEMITRHAGILLQTSEGTVEVRTSMNFRDMNFKGPDSHMIPTAANTTYITRDLEGTLITQLDIQPEHSRYVVDSNIQLVELEITPLTMMEKLSEIEQMNPDRQLVERLRQSIATDELLLELYRHKYGFQTTIETRQTDVVVLTNRNNGDGRIVQPLDTAKQEARQHYDQQHLAPQSFDEVHHLFEALQTQKLGEV